MVEVANRVAVVGCFVHVEPNAIELNILEELVNHVLPDCLRIVIEEVEKDSVKRPHLACQNFAIGVLEETVNLYSLIVWRVPLTDSLCYASVDNWHIVDVDVVQPSNEVAQPFVVDLVVGEVFIIAHVVNVGPYYVKWKVVSSVLDWHLLKLLQIFVAPSGLRPTE